MNVLFLNTPYAGPAAWLLTLALLAAGCAGPNHAADATDDGGTPAAGSASLAGTSWQLARFGSAATGGARAVAGEADVTAAFAEDGRLSGNGGCNRYFGTYQAEGARLSFSEIGATKRACGSPLTEQEQAYFRALESARAWERDDRLTLLDGAGEPLLHFEPHGEETP